MVREANVKQATAEKQLKEAQGKVGSYFTTYVNPSLKSVSAIHLFFLSPLSQIDVLQAEVTALKTLVLTSTPSSPNRQLHPQLLSPGSRGHTRHKSATLTLPQLQSESPSENAHISREEKEVYRQTVLCHGAGIRQLQNHPAFTSVSSRGNFFYFHRSCCDLNFHL